MTELLSGKPVAAAVKEAIAARVHACKKNGHPPKLQLIRVGENADALAYQKSLEKAALNCDIQTSLSELAADCSQQELETALQSAAEDDGVAGILLFCPLPAQLDEQAARRLIPTAKDVDCLNPASSGAIFTDQGQGFAPCTAAAVIELLHHYQIPIAGKRVVIVGRSLVVGKPLAMLLLRENATVTIAHSKTESLASLCRDADILITAIGKAKLFGPKFFRPRQVVVDVGINEDPDQPGELCGDVDFDFAKEIVAGITPVPGGIGAITSSILCRQVVEACERQHPATDPA